MEGKEIPESLTKGAFSRKKRTIAPGDSELHNKKIGFHLIVINSHDKKNRWEHVS